MHHSGMGKQETIAGTIAHIIGKGILAGLAGTAAISLAQRIEMKITGREPSDSPAKAVNKTLHIEATDEEHKEAFVEGVHWAYGTLWGLARGALDAAGLRGPLATAVHFAAVWGTAMVMLPALKIAPPVKEWGAKSIATDGAEHLVYGIAAGLAYDAID